MMKKITIVLALCTIVVEHSFAFIPHLRMAARDRAQKNMPTPVQNAPQNQIPDQRMPEPTCAILIDFCLELTRRDVTSKNSREFKAFDQWRTDLINAGALKDCVNNASYWINRLSTALEEEEILQKTAPADYIQKTALTNEMLSKLLHDIKVELKKLDAQHQQQTTNN